MITAYDFSFAKLFDKAGIDVILVGDSAGNVMAGYETTVPVTLEQMIYHAPMCVRGAERPLVVVDMPFGSYQSNTETAVASAIRIMKETGGPRRKDGRRRRDRGKRCQDRFCGYPGNGSFGINTPIHL